MKQRGEAEGQYGPRQLCRVAEAVRNGDLGVGSGSRAPRRRRLTAAHRVRSALLRQPARQRAALRGPQPTRCLLRGFSDRATVGTLHRRNVVRNIVRNVVRQLQPQPAPRRRLGYLCTII